MLQQVASQEFGVSAGIGITPTEQKKLLCQTGICSTKLFLDSGGIMAFRGDKERAGLFCRYALLYRPFVTHKSCCVSLTLLILVLAIFFWRRLAFLQL